MEVQAPRKPFPGIWNNGSPGSGASSRQIMDHKLAGKNEGSLKEIAATWAPQLALYATAIARVSGKPPVGTWLNLPLEGRAVRVSDAV